LERNSAGGENDEPLYRGRPARTAKFGQGFAREKGGATVPRRGDNGPGSPKKTRCWWRKISLPFSRGVGGTTWKIGHLGFTGILTQDGVCVGRKGGMQEERKQAGTTRDIGRVEPVSLRPKTKKTNGLCDGDKGAGGSGTRRWNAGVGNSGKDGKCAGKGEELPGSPEGGGPRTEKPCRVTSQKFSELLKCRQGHGEQGNFAGKKVEQKRQNTVLEWGGGGGEWSTKGCRRPKRAVAIFRILRPARGRSVCEGERDVMK